MPLIWKPAAIALDVEQLPPLPVINDQALRTQAFLHRSFLTDPEAAAYNAEMCSLKPLGFLGDSVIQQSVTVALVRAFPSLSVGCLTVSLASSESGLSRIHGAMGSELELSLGICDKFTDLP
jgi:hypothetical protein